MTSLPRRLVQGFPTQAVGARSEDGQSKMCAMRIGLLFILLVGCGNEPRKQAPLTGSAAPAPNSPTSPLDDGRTLLLEHHVNTDGEASYLVVAFDANPVTKPVLTPLDKVPALELVNWPGHFATVAAHRGLRWVHAVADGKRWKLIVGATSVTAGGKPSFQIDLGDRPTALHIAGDALYVGTGQSVGWFDLAIMPPKYVELVKRDGPPHKSYDLFVHTGDRLVAIDDEVFPMYADWFSIDASGRPIKRLGDWTLPGVVNGHYDHAVLVANGEHVLYLDAQYGTLSGDGHVLAAIPIRSDKLVFDAGLTLQNGTGSTTPIVDERVDRGGGRPDMLLGGTHYSGWSGLAATRDGKRLLLAANTRGLLVLPSNFTATSKAQFVDLGGECRDVREQAGVLFALVVATTGSELVVLESAGPDFKVIARHALPAGYDRFVR